MTARPNPANRPRHPKKEFEELLRSVEKQGWVVDKGKYFRIRCPNECKCMRWIHLTPSSPNYHRDAMMWLRRCPCWREENE